jgi:hypothetical protein
LSKYVFFTDPTYSTTNLVFVRQQEDGAFHDVELACAGSIGGWQPVDAAGRYQVATFDLIAGGNRTGACDNGPQTARSDGPFGLLVWGLDEYASYAYPAGGNLHAINDVVIPPVE